MPLQLDNPSWIELADEHRQWLSPFNPQYLANWEKLLNNDSEAAICEAAVRRWLQASGVSVKPNERLTGNCGGPDFSCSNGVAHFYVEVACISIANAENRTSIKNESKRQFAPYNVMGMTEAVFAKCHDKAPQCANLDGPALVAVGTFHELAAMVGFDKMRFSNVLTGKTSLAWNICIQTGQQIGETYNTTEFEKAAFLRHDDVEEVGFKRSSISGVVALSVGTWPIKGIGVLHPNPARMFSTSLLPDFEFGEIEIDRVSKQLRVCWPRG
jgi:hypothetical protein